MSWEDRVLNAMNLVNQDEYRTSITKATLPLIYQDDEDVEVIEPVVDEE